MKPSESVRSLAQQAREAELADGRPSPYDGVTARVAAPGGSWVSDQHTFAGWLQKRLVRQVRPLSRDTQNAAGPHARCSPPRRDGWQALRERRPIQDRLGAEYMAWGSMRKPSC